MSLSTVRLLIDMGGDKRHFPGSFDCLILFTKDLIALSTYSAVFAG